MITNAKMLYLKEISTMGYLETLEVYAKLFMLTPKAVSVLGLLTYLTTGQVPTGLTATQKTILMSLCPALGEQTSAPTCPQLPSSLTLLK